MTITTNAPRTEQRTDEWITSMAAATRRHLLNARGTDVTSVEDDALLDLLTGQAQMRLADQVVPVEPADARLLRLIEDSTPDEAASVLTFATGRHVESFEVAGLALWNGGDAA